MKHLIVNILTSLRKEVYLNVKALQHERSTISGRMTAENPERPQHDLHHRQRQTTYPVKGN